MERFLFEDIADVGNYMYEAASEDGVAISAVLLYDEADELVRWLLEYDDIAVGSIRMEHPDYNGYQKEFYITLGIDLFLDVAPAHTQKSGDSRGKYENIETDILLLGGDVNSRIAIQNDCSDKFEIAFEDEETSERGMDSDGCVCFDLSEEDVPRLIDLIRCIFC